MGLCCNQLQCYSQHSGDNQATHLALLHSKICGPVAILTKPILALHFYTYICIYSTEVAGITYSSHSHVYFAVIYYYFILWSLVVCRTAGKPPVVVVGVLLLVLGIASCKYILLCTVRRSYRGVSGPPSRPCTVN